MSTDKETVDQPGRRRFLGQGLAIAVGAVLTGALSESVLALPVDASGDRLPARSMPQRRLGALTVSAIGLGCLPMVGLLRWTLR